MVLYKVKFKKDSAKMRTSILSMISGVGIFISPKNNFIYLSVDSSAIEKVEHTLQKIKQIDGYCNWKKV